MSGLILPRLTGIGRFLQTIVMGDMNRDNYTKAQDRLNRWHTAWSLVQSQAADDGLWFLTDDVTIAYLQQELRRLHRVIEGDKEPGAI